MSSMFYGIGLGPGDPELLTIKALNILKQVDLVFTPASRENRSLAAEIVRWHLPETRFEYLEFPMTEDRTKLILAWEQAAAKVGSLLASKNVAFVTLGDPLLYGTYLYLYRCIKENYPAVKIITVPGIPGMCAAAAGSNFYLTAENDRLLLLTGKVDLQEFTDYCRIFETIVVYKPRSNFKELIKCFYEAAPAGSGVIVKRCGMAEESVTYLNKEYYPAEIDYFTTVILHPKESL